MIKVHIDELLQKRGKRRYWLAKETGMTQTALSLLSRGKTTRIEFLKLDAICKALDCQPGDVLERVENGKEEEY